LQHACNYGDDLVALWCWHREACGLGLAGWPGCRMNPAFRWWGQDAPVGNAFVMKRLTASIPPGESGWWLVAFNPETGTTSQGRSVEQALRNRKQATELYLKEMGA
jgi:predicted RNase H-like HicB family nuclease